MATSPFAQRRWCKSGVRKDIETTSGTNRTNGRGRLVANISGPEYVTLTVVGALMKGKASMFIGGG